MKKNILLICLLIAVVISGCKKDEDDPVPVPVASFTITNNDCDAPCGVTFTNSSLHATSYLWDFGDGNTSNTGSPRHIYTAPGDYIVKLVATNTSGSHSFSDSVTIVPTVLHLRYKINSSLIEPTTFLAQREVTPNVLTITANNFGISLAIPPSGLSNGQTITFNQQSFSIHHVYWNGFGGSSFYTSEFHASGITMEIDYVDYVQGGIMSGTFSGSLSTGSGTTVPVTEGSFKVQFSN